MTPLLDLPVQAQELKEFKANDGVNLVTYLIKSGGYALPDIKVPKAVVILVTEENTVWQPYQQLTSRFGEKGAFNLIVETRGQGGSICKANGTNVFMKNFTNADWATIPSDLKIIVEQGNGKLWPKNTPVILVGFSKTANVVGVAASQIPLVKGVIMISPGLDYMGLQPFDSLKKFGGRVMFAVAEKDKASADAVTKLAQAVPADRVDMVRSLNGDLHGLKILKIEPFLPDRMNTFITKCFNQK